MCRRTLSGTTYFFDLFFRVLVKDNMETKTASKNDIKRNNNKQHEKSAKKTMMIVITKQCKAEQHNQQKKL